MMIKQPETFAEWLSLFCLTHNTTAAQIADKIGLSKSMMSLIKQDKRPIPSFFVDCIIEQYKLKRDEAEELLNIVSKHRKTIYQYPNNRNTHSLTKVSFSQPWTKEFMSLAAKVVNKLDMEDIEHLMEEMTRLYKEKTGTSLRTEPMAELINQFVPPIRR